MKLLMFNTDYFKTTPTIASLPGAEENPPVCETNGAVVVFMQVEAEDPEKGNSLVTKAIKNIKWMCNKCNRKTVVLHSFSHLSSSKSAPEEAKKIMDAMQQRLENAEYEVFQTAYGWMNRLEMNAPAETTFDRVFKEI